MLSMITGCSQGKKDEASDASGAVRDDLILAIGGENESGFDPITGWGRYGNPLFHSTLLKRDDNLNIVNDLATEYEVSDDGLTWTVNIRDDVFFHDGKPLTAEDVAFTFQTAKESGSIVDLGILASAKAIDDTTVVFTLTEPRSTFLYQLVATGIVPKHAWGPEYAKNPIGSGPYRFVQWNQGQQLIVEANEKYYGGAPSIRKITFLFMDEDAAFAAAKAGKVDVVSVPASFATQKVPGMRLAAVPSIDNRGIMFPFVPDEGKTTKDGYPIGNDVTADIAIRKAINIAVDRDALVEGVLEGFGSPAYSVCDNMPWWNPEVVFEDGDIEAAKKLLAAAGWKDENADGILEKNGLEARFTLIYPANDLIRQSLALATSDQVKAIGIEIVPKGKSWDDIQKLMHSNAVLFGWGSYDPLEMYNLYSSKYAGVDWWNTGFYSNSKVDEYMNKALATTDEKVANELWKKAQWDGSTGFSAKGDAPWAWLVNLDHCYFIAEDLDTGTQRIQPHGHGWPITANIVDWRWK